MQQNSKHTDNENHKETEPLPSVGSCLPHNHLRLHRLHDGLQNRPVHLQTGCDGRPQLSWPRRQNNRPGQKGKTDFRTLASRPRPCYPPPSTARAAAARRNTAKKSAETEIKEPVAEPETDARPKLTAGTASVATPRRDKAPAERCARSASTCAVSSVGKRADSRPLSLRT